MAINGIGLATTLPTLRPASEPAAGKAEQVMTKQAQAKTATAPTAEGASLVPKVQNTGTDKQAEAEAVQAAVDKVQKFVNPVAASVQFTVDREFDTMVVQVVDRDTKEVIRQIPSEEMLELARALDKLQGLLVKQQA